MNISKFLLKLFGWKTRLTVPNHPKAIICVAPHTSNWDFVIGKLAYTSTGRRSGFLMKESWFFFPLGCIFRAMGGVAVPRKKGSELTDSIATKFHESEKMVLAITPEGTRKQNPKWRKGFLYIAVKANIPIQLAYIDYKEKEIGIVTEFKPTGDIEADLHIIKEYYKNFNAKYPEKFCI